VKCATVLGYHTPGDDGGGKFYWDPSATEAENGGTVIVPSSTPPTGRWKRLVEGSVSVKRFGAVGDGQVHPLSNYFATLQAAQAVYPHATSLTDEIDWAAIHAAIDVAPGDTVTLSLSGGNYTLSKYAGVGRQVTRDPGWRVGGAHVGGYPRHSDAACAQLLSAHD
jgi:hypothetical protein